MPTISERLNSIANDMKAMHLLLELIPYGVQGKPHVPADDYEVKGTVQDLATSIDAHKGYYTSNAETLSLNQIPSGALVRTGSGQLGFGSCVDVGFAYDSVLGNRNDPSYVAATKLNLSILDNTEEVILPMSSQASLMYSIVDKAIQYKISESEVVADRLNGKEGGYHSAVMKTALENGSLYPALLKHGEDNTSAIPYIAFVSGSRLAFYLHLSMDGLTWHSIELARDCVGYMSDVEIMTLEECRRDISNLVHIAPDGRIFLHCPTDTAEMFACVSCLSDMNPRDVYSLNQIPSAWVYVHPSNTLPAKSRVKNGNYVRMAMDKVYGKIYAWFEGGSETPIQIGYDHGYMGVNANDKYLNGLETLRCNLIKDIDSQMEAVYNSQECAVSLNRMVEPTDLVHMLFYHLGTAEYGRCMGFTQLTDMADGYDIDVTSQITITSHDLLTNPAVGSASDTSSYGAAVVVDENPINCNGKPGIDTGESASLYRAEF